MTAGKKQKNWIILFRMLDCNSMFFCCFFDSVKKKKIILKIIVQFLTIMDVFFRRKEKLKIKKMCSLTTHN